MHYSDSEFCPASFEAYRKCVIGETSLSLFLMTFLLKST